MKNYVSLDKRSKKAQREYYSKQRRTWGEVNPVTRRILNAAGVQCPSGEERPKR